MKQPAWWVRRWACVLLAAPFALLVLPQACNGNGGGGDGGPPEDGPSPVIDGEPVLCTEFTEAGAPCPTASPVRCFPECEAGGCYCQETAHGRVWVCQTDLSCIPDCAPLDDGCATVPMNDVLVPEDAGGGGLPEAGAPEAGATESGAADGGGGALDAPPGEASSGG